MIAGSALRLRFWIAVISDSCVVVVGALVTRGVYPPYSIIGGVLAGVIKKR